MKSTITRYALTQLVEVEVTRYPRSRNVKIEFIVGGEGRLISKEELTEFILNVEMVKKDLGLKGAPDDN